MPEITRVNGGAQPGSWYGLSPRYFKIETGNVNFGNVSDSANASYYGAPNSNYEKAVRVVSTVASIVTLGAPAADGNIFIVQVDDSCPSIVGLSNATVNTSSVATEIRSSLNANTVTITESTGFVGGAFNTFA